MSAPTIDNDLFDGAKNEFASMEDLDGRLVAIWVTGKGTRESKTSGKQYEYCETVTLVLDNGLDGTKVTDLVPAAPHTLDGFQHSTGGLVARLRTRVGTPKPLVGRINSQPSKVNKQVRAYGISEPTEGDVAIVQANRALIVKVRDELQAKSTADLF